MARAVDDLRQYQLPKTEPTPSTSKDDNEVQSEEEEDAPEAKKRLFDSLASALPSASQRALAVSDPESDGEVEAAMAANTVENAWRGDGDSDAESVDSDLEDPLK